MNKSVCLAVLLVLSGCGLNTTAVVVDQNGQYVVSVHSSMADAPAVRRAALREASHFCDRKNQMARIISEKSDNHELNLTVTFACEVP